MAQNFSKNLSFVGRNIRKIRQAKKISQAEFAVLFNLARPSIGAYEEGRSEPKIETLLHIAAHFNITVDFLLKRELTVSEIYSFNLLNKKLDSAHQLNPYGKGSRNMKLVRPSKYLDYIVNHQSRDFIQHLDEIGIIREGKGELRAFELMGDEMTFQGNGLRHGDVFIGRQVSTSNWKKYSGQVVAVVHSSNIVIRRMKSADKKTVTLLADNQNYSELMIKHSEIFEIWEGVGIYSEHLKPPSRTEERLSKIEAQLKQLSK